VSVAENEFYERYLAKAIAEINALEHEVGEWAGRRQTAQAAVVGSGHPLADIFMLKHRPKRSETQEGVAFFGRAGQAILNCLQRLHIDPTVLYGTNCLKVDAEHGPDDLERSRSWLTQEIHITQPRIVVVMGEEARVELNELGVPLGRPVEPRVGEVQRLTPSCEALYVPDIDRALDEEAAKRAFWQAFRALGAWYADFPPY
jgi:uracil-DNA glycosylase family 4